ncbi:MAG: hypothetical protein MUC97_13495 [Bernardetiaceae bacterium]|jgi:hypothetical protein|nr:hypothetical protein [Bernardetiaceae bacterium]
MNLDQALAEVKVGGQVMVTIVTNQDNGITSYATGALIYHASSMTGPHWRSARLSTTGGSPAKYYFSDRMLDIDPPSPPGTFGHSPRQPFSANAIDNLGISISLFNLNLIVVKFTLHSWGNATFNVSMEKRGSLLIGTGAPIGNLSDHATYLMSFHGVINPPR